MYVTTKILHTQQTDSEQKDQQIHTAWDHLEAQAAQTRRRAAQD